MRLDYFNEKFDAIVPLSGGIDSTAALYKALKENPNKK